MRMCSNVDRAAGGRNCRRTCGRRTERSRTHWSRPPRSWWPVLNRRSVADFQLSTEGMAECRPLLEMVPSLVNVIRGACGHDCPDTCSWIVEVRDGVAGKLFGDPAHPFT